MLARHVVRPLASAVGGPLERVRGVTGRLARENATRNPGRTATTAAALMIGLALVTFVTHPRGRASRTRSPRSVDKGVHAARSWSQNTDGFSHHPGAATGTALQRVPGVGTDRAIRASPGARSAGWAAPPA